MKNINFTHKQKEFGNIFNFKHLGCFNLSFPRLKIKFHVAYAFHTDETYRFSRNFQLCCVSARLFHKLRFFIAYDKKKHMQIFLEEVAIGDIIQIECVFFCFSVGPVLAFFCHTFIYVFNEIQKLCAKF